MYLSILSFLWTSSTLISCFPPIPTFFLILSAFNIKFSYNKTKCLVRYLSWYNRQTVFFVEVLNFEHLISVVKTWNSKVSWLICILLFAYLILSYFCATILLILDIIILEYGIWFPCITCSWLKCIPYQTPSPPLFLEKQTDQ